MEKRYVIRIAGELIDVSEEIYREYYSAARRERTQAELDQRNRLVHYDAWDTEKSVGAEAIASKDKQPEEIVAAEIDANKLKRCVARLSEEERELIHALFYSGKSLSGLSRELGIPRKTLESRRDRILKKLRVYFDAPDRKN